MSDLDQAVSAVVRDCLGVKEGEEVLVVCNPATLGSASAMRAEAGRAGAEAVLATDGRAGVARRRAAGTVAEAMAAADVVLAPTVQSLSHTAARKRASEAGARIATLPGVTEEMLARVMSADMAELRRRGGAVAERARRRARRRVITCPNGSDLHLDLSGPDGDPRRRRADRARAPSGTCRAARASSRPAGGWGTLVIDGSLAGSGWPSEPVELVVEDGHLTSARGGQGMAFMELLTAHGEDGTNVAELGIGTNEKAILTGNILEDEKILGTAPRRLRRLGRDRRQRAGPGAPRLRRDEADGRAGWRGDRARRRAAGLMGVC